MGDPVETVLKAMRGGDWEAVRLLLHPYLRWQSEDGQWLRGRTRVLERLRSVGTPRPPASVELRDGQIYRWFAATGDGGPGGRAKGQRSPRGAAARRSAT
jgi:hypothetical protein